ncbi:hypothetical protein LCAUCD174_0002 [Lacticaseibacillus paracasei]|nr:hypothetical protein LCA32G_1622 [Lacticaseibacillus paracasei]EKP98083.1 hypothetical protein LCA211_2001 [Lacticaseibacillus casei 21/1]EKQ23957.1 hypothetical protein LCAUCD174_0002 [Lacticaseibacillus paracasei]
MEMNFPNKTIVHEVSLNAQVIINRVYIVQFTTQP